MRKYIKQFIKYDILKLCFILINAVSPSLAIDIRNRIYGFVDRFKKKNNGESADRLSVSGFLSSADILVDSTKISRQEFITGIQRVIKQFIINFPAGTVLGRIYQYDQFITNYQLLDKFSGKNSVVQENYIDISKAKKLILLDCSWEYKRQFEKFVDIVQANGGVCYALVHDLIPIRYPEYFDGSTFINIFRNWHNMVINKCDHIVCVSKATADDVIKYYDEGHFIRKKPLQVSYCVLGADIKKHGEVNLKYIRPRLTRFFNKPTFLMVGTLEPRKGHMIALQAFTKLLDAGKDINLLIIGRNGWKNDDIRDYIANSNYNKTNILWLEDASDYELIWAYQKSCCLIAASLTEGYGLPLVEGAQYGIPLICSDIPVFREVSQGYADFFKVFDVDALAGCIEKWLQSDVHPDSRKIKIYTWKEAADIFMEIVDGKREPYRVLK